jgi:hypothetical protein
MSRSHNGAKSINSKPRPALPPIRLKDRIWCDALSWKSAHILEISRQKITVARQRDLPRYGRVELCAHPTHRACVLNSLLAPADGKAGHGSLPAADAVAGPITYFFACLRPLCPVRVGASFTMSWASTSFHRASLRASVAGMLSRRSCATADTSALQTKKAAV